MVLNEYRITLPLSVEEFQVAQLYMVVKASNEGTGDGEGVEWLKNEPFDNTDGHMGLAEKCGLPVPKRKGQYTLKVYHLASHIPSIVAAMLPATAMVLVEESWNCYPYCLTVLTNGYLDKEKFRISVESVHLPDNGTTENALNMTPAELKKRTVEVLDITTLDPAEAEYKAEYDPTKFLSKKTGRGKLTAGWEKTAKPVMTCYKRVDANFKYWPMQGTVEGNITAKNRKLYRQTLAQAFCLIDEWHGMTMKDIRRLEAESKVRLAKALGKPVSEEDEAKAADASAAASADAAAATDDAAAAAAAATTTAAASDGAAAPAAATTTAAGAGGAGAGAGAASS